MKIYIEPRFRGVDEGEGGIRRIVEAQRRWLPRFDVEVRDTIDDADLIATHAGIVGDISPSLPWVVHTHGLYWKELSWPKWGHDMNRQVIDAMRRADHVTAPSEWVAQALRRGMWLRPTVLHHGIDPDDWEPSKSPGSYALWNKNRPDPICDPEPVNLLAKQAPDLQIISTFGDKLPNLRVTGRIGFEEMKGLIQNAGVYLSPTRETFGIGTLEAMACGVPVVAWAWGGQREIIRHGETGWLCPPGDYEGLEEGVRWAMANRKRVGEAAREDVLSRWTWEQLMPPYIDLYQRAILGKDAQYQSPTVSVIIPCHNLAKYLPDAIRSLSAQTFTDWEAIIVNDASPDDTQGVADALAQEDPRIRVITNKDNLYLAGALNAGIADACGRYILPLDADNMLEPWTLGILASALDADRGVHIAYGACRFVLEDGFTPDAQVGTGGLSKWPTDFSFRGQITHHNQIPSTCMYRREVWERSGGYRRRCRTAEDAENWTRVTSLGFVADRVTSKPTLIYRQRDDSMSRVQADWDWTAWFPWSRRIELVPFGVNEKPPSKINQGICWPVSSYEPPKISIIIPVGSGHQDLVIDALDSVAAQTFQEWECIVINDTGEPLSIPHNWVKVIEPEDPSVRLGPARARNMAISQSTASLFVPLDADDYLQPDALTLMYQTWRHFKGAVYSQWYDDKGGDRIELYDPPDYDANLLIQKGSIHAVTALYPKGAWVEVGGFDEDLSHWEDWDFQIKLAAIGVCGSKIPRPLFTYRKVTGERRESNMKAFTEGKNAILAKWSHVWDGKEELMACSGCPGGGGRRYASPPTIERSAMSAKAFNPREGYTILEYQARSKGTRTYVGKDSGVRYRFGTDTAHRTKYVFVADVPGFMNLSEGGIPLFKELTAAPKIEEVMPFDAIVAQGPPIKETPPETSEHTPDVSQVVEHLTIKELKKRIGEWDIEKVARYLGHEKAQENPRTTAVKLLTDRMLELQQVAV